MALEQGDLVALSGQMQGGGKAGEAATDHNDFAPGWLGQGGGWCARGAGGFPDRGGGFFGGLHWGTIGWNGGIVEGQTKRDSMPAAQVFRARRKG